MTHLDIIRSWKDEEYRLSLSEAERTQLPAHPAGLIELTDAQLDAMAGGYSPLDFCWFFPDECKAVGTAVKDGATGFVDALADAYSYIANFGPLTIPNSTMFGGTR